MFKNIIYLATITILFVKCTNELPNPLTVKGMKLGLDYEEQKKIGELNEMCENVSPENFRYIYAGDKKASNECVYKIKENIYAVPFLIPSVSNTKKILSSVKLLFYSSKYAPNVAWFDGRVYDNYGYMTLSDVYDLNDMFVEKYGETKRSMFVIKQDELGFETGTKTWFLDDLIIKMEYQEIPGFIQKYLCQVTYEYNNEIKSSLKSNDNI
jgi:hypothetical protein